VTPVYEGKSPEEGEFKQDRSAQFRPHRNSKSGQETSKRARPVDALSHFGKTDVRYWQERVFQPTYTRNGIVHRISEWAIKIQHLGHRETFSLGTANRAAAGAKAKQIFLLLKGSGWQTVLTTFKPRASSERKTAVTVGEFIAHASSISTARPKTVASYCRAFRTIVADIFKISGGSAKFDYSSGGGREKWLAQIHAIRLSDISPEKIQRWKVSFLQRAGTDPIKRRVAQASVNSLMRQAKTLFAPKIIKFIDLNIVGTPFDGVAFEPRRSMRYRGKFDVAELISAAQTDLSSEPLKIFLLAIMAGLRRNEIDKLEWSSFQWTRNVIRIEATSYLQPKSEDSIGDVEVDEELMEIFRRFKLRAKGDFVIESNVAPRIHATYSHYRCERDFTLLTEWLRDHGVTGNRPLHSLRKEYGSQVCAKHGIYAASQALRHADIAITSAHYLTPRTRVTAGLGKLLATAGTNSTRDFSH
jgi:integrase